MVQAREGEPDAPNPLFWRVWPVARPRHISIDPNGNLTQKIDGSDTWTYEWDAENRLKRVLKNAVEQARFAYDPLGRRVEKVAGGVTTTYTYDGQNILREIAGATTLKYVHGPGIDEPLAQEDGAGVLTYFHADGLGSIVKTTNSAGAVLTSRRYDAFGNLELGVTNGYAFTGREWDGESGLYYYRFRYYDPRIGRFISEDPAGFTAGFNRYAYVSNQPITYSDPLGLFQLRNFPPARAQQMQQAIEAVVKKLSEKPCCAGDDGPELVKVIQNATFIYQPSITFLGSGACGKVDWGNFFRGEIQVSEIAFYKMFGCCGIEHTIVHEATHLLSVRHKVLGDSPRLPGGGGPYKNAAACYPCE